MKAKKVLKRLVIAVAIFLSVIIVTVGGFYIYNSLRNRFISDLGNYILDKYGAVQSVNFDRNSINSLPCCEIAIYIDPENCTFDEAREIFEDLVGHFTDDLIVKLREEKGHKGRLVVDFNKKGDKPGHYNYISVYSFETRDTEGFIHWRATRGNPERYEFDRPTG